jgi:hypothetical protein
MKNRCPRLYIAVIAGFRKPLNIRELSKYDSSLTQLFRSVDLVHFEAGTMPSRGT